MAKKALNKWTAPKSVAPEKIIQFGEGNFLRAFVDWIVWNMNAKTNFNGSVAVVQPIEVDGRHDYLPHRGAFCQHRAVRVIDSAALGGEGHVRQLLVDRALLELTALNEGKQRQPQQRRAKADHQYQYDKDSRALPHTLVGTLLGVFF